MLSARDAAAAVAATLEADEAVVEEAVADAAARPARREAVLDADAEPADVASERRAAEVARGADTMFETDRKAR